MLKNNTKREIVNKIEAIASQLSDIPVGAIDASVNVYFLNLSGRPKCLIGDAARLYYEVAQAFRRDEPFATKISLSLLKRLFEELLSEYAQVPHTKEQTTLLIDRLQEEALSKVRSWYYYMAIQGVVFKTPEIDFGKHQLMQMDATRFDLLRQQFFSIIDRMPVDDQMKQFHRDNTIRSFDGANDLRNHACLRMEIEGDDDLMGEVAVAEAMPVIHVLTYLGLGYTWSTWKSPIGFGSAFTQQSCSYPRISTDLTVAGFSSERTPNTQILEVTNSALAKMNELGLPEFIDIYKRRRTGLSEIEKALQRAIQFFYNGYTSLESTSEFVNYMMVLECFLSPSDRVELSNTIAEGLAVLLEQDCERRIRFKKYVKSLYIRRSGIVHGGVDSIDTRSVRDAMYLAYKIIEIMLQNHKLWKKRDDIAVHIDKIKFS